MIGILLKTENKTCDKNSSYDNYLFIYLSDDQIESKNKNKLLIRFNVYPSVTCFARVLSR